MRKYIEKERRLRTQRLKDKDYEKLYKRMED